MLNKLTLYLCAIVPLTGALSACSSDNVSADIPEQGFGVTFTAREASRATLTSDLNITDNTFVVYGDMVQTSTPTATPTTVFDATPVTYADGKWSYANLQYWFPSHTYSFVALHPAADNNVSDINYQNSQLSFTYTYPDDYTQATDLLVANHRRRYSDNRTDNGSGTINPVEFNFRHLMARLDFVANVDPAIGNGSVTIHSISLRNVNTQATYTVLPATTTSQTDDFTTSAWSNQSELSDNIFTITEEVTLPDRTGTPTVYSHAYFPATSNPLLVIPQEVPQDVEVVISYTRTPQGGSPEYVPTAVSKLFSTTVAAHQGKWEAGKSYSYSFTIGVDDLIIFSTPTVQTWSDSEGGNYII